MRNITLIPNIPYKLPEIIDITDKLPAKGPWEAIKKKYTVKGKWDKITYHEGYREPEEIDTIIIHHSGPPEGKLESHAKYHADKWGAGISYHMVIDDGRIKQVNNLLSFTYHAGNHNTYTVGICVNRDLRNADLTSQERELLYAAVLAVKAVLPIKHILGHNEVCPTACPCTSMNRIRSDIESLEQQMSFAQTPQKQAELAYRMANEILWTYNLSKGKDEHGQPVTEERRQWAVRRLLQLEQPMRGLGMLK